MNPLQFYRHYYPDNKKADFTVEPTITFSVN